MLEESRDLIEAGGSIVVLRPRDKRPTDSNWTQQPRLTWDEARKSFPAGHNIGVRLGEPSRIDGSYLLGIDLDIRSTAPDDIHDAWDKLADLIGDTGRFSSVRSGSGGDSRHLYARCDAAIRTKKLARSEHKVAGRDGKKHWAWEIDLGGTGRQFVLPPSIHPLTRQPYTWEVKVPWDRLPVLKAAEVRGWSPVDSLSTAIDSKGLSDLAAWAAEQPKRFTRQEIEDILDTLSGHRASRDRYVEDREGWVSVGMALHHQSQGENWGFEAWCSFSNGSDKFDPDDQWDKWRSFGKTAGSRVPLTMASLKRYAQDVRTADATGSALPERDEEPDLPDDFGARAAPRERRSRMDSLLDGEVDADGIPFDPEGDSGPLPNWKRALNRLEDEMDAAWRRELDRSDNENIKPNVHNITLITANDPRTKGWIGYNDFIHEQVQLRELKPEGLTMIPLPQRDRVNGDVLTKEHDHNLRLWLARPRVGRMPGHGINATDRDLKTAVVSAAYQNRFHPIKNYLAGRRWDGKPRISTLFMRFLGCANDAYHREVATLMMVAAVARVHEPGHKFDYAVILEGEEGLRKSSFIRALAGRDQWFGELHGDFHDRKNLVEQMQGKWIIELPELSGFNRSDVTAIKSFMSAPFDKVRLAYEARSAQFERQCIFIGSTNDQQYLQSETGNRRFFPVRVLKEIDTTGLRAEVDQLWAEATALYRAQRAEHPATLGALPLFLKGEAARSDALKVQADRKIETVSDVVFGLVEAYISTRDTIAAITGSVADKFHDNGAHYLPSKVCAAQLHASIPSMANRPITNADVSVLNTAMRRLKWESAILSFPGLGKQRGFRRPGATDSELRHGYIDAKQE